MDKAKFFDIVTPTLFVVVFALETLTHWVHDERYWFDLLIGTLWLILVIMRWRNWRRYEAMEDKWDRLMG